MRLGRLFRPDEKRQKDVERLKGWVRAALAVDDSKTVSISEIECGDPSCPGGIETAVLVRGKASVEAAFKLRGPLDSLSEAMVADAVGAWRAARMTGPAS